MTNQAEQLLFDHVLTAFIQRGLVKGGGKQRTDATPVIAAVRHLNQHAIVAPDWLRSWVPTIGYERYGERIDSVRLPKAQTQRDAQAQTIGQDGQTLLTALDQTDTPPELATEPAVETLRQVWAQQYVQTDTGIRWRTKEELPPNAERIASPYDPDARASTKRNLRWEGYQVHVTETGDDDAPPLITHVETVPATTPDGTQTVTIHEAVAEHDLLPSEHYVDGGSTSAAHLVTSQGPGIALIGPVGGNTSWQAQTEDGIRVQQFTMDWERQVATCPEDHQSIQWRAREHEVRVTFDRETCAAGPHQEQCTRATRTGRVLQLHPHPQQEAWEARRAEQQTPAFREQYQRRAGVEGTISQGVRRFGMRRCRYIGLAKTRLQQLIMAVAINLVRLLAWLLSPPDAPPAMRRPSAFTELQAT